MPYFSILLPTKNRSHLVGYAIRSVLQQNFDDFEIIVCDNDDDEVATRSVVQGFADDRIIYRRTGGLDMVSNWNSALDAASGEHVTVLEDKMIFYPGALSEIRAKIEQSSSGVVVWHCDICNDSQSPARLVQYESTGQENVKSLQILELITKDVFKNWGRLPRGLSCTVPRSVVSEIVNHTGHEFYQPMSPDFVSAIKILAQVDELLAVYKAYTLVVSVRASTGNSTLTGKESALKYYSGQKIVNLSDDFVPVKNTTIVVNSVINDYRAVAAVSGGRIKGYGIEHKDYVKMMARDLLVSTFAARKLLWDRVALSQLVRSENREVRNLYYIFSYFVGFTVTHFLKLLGIGVENRRTKVSSVDNEPLEKIDAYLSGQTSLGSAENYPRQESRNV